MWLNSLLLLFLDVTLFHFKILIGLDHLLLILIQHVVKVLINNLVAVIVYVPHADVSLLDSQLAYGIFNRFDERTNVQLYILNWYVRNSMFYHFLL